MHATFRVVHLDLAEWRSMLSVSTRPWLILLVTCVAFFAAGSVRAGGSVGADILSVPGLKMAGMQVDVTASPEGRGVAVALAAQHADVPAMGWKKVGVAVAGTLDRDESGRWLFDGTVHL